MQVCPVAAKMPDTTPLTALSRSASGNTSCADLPPSSSVVRLKVWAALRNTWRPEFSPPVKAILSTPLWLVSGSPTSAPNPVTTLSTPGGKPASSTSRISSIVDAEVNSDGLITMVQPAAKAGASFQVASSSGEFHGVIAATTPTGSWRV